MLHKTPSINPSKGKNVPVHRQTDKKKPPTSHEIKK